MPMLKSIASALRTVLEIIVGTALAVLSLSVLTQIVLREVFTYAFLPLDDLIPYSFSITTFAGAALLFGEGGHISITIFTDLMPAGIRRFAIRLASLISVLFLVFFLAYGWDFMMDGWYQFSPLLNIRLCYVFVIVPFSAAAGLLLLTVHLLEGGAAADNQ